MVVEALLFPSSAEKRPWIMFFIGFLYTSIAVLMSLWIFKDQASLIMVFMITMATIPLFYNAIKLEESKDMIMESESMLLKEHNKAITFFMYMFVGFTIACAFWYLVLPSGTANSLFEKQSSTIRSINNEVSGNVAIDLGMFWKVFLNNFKVLMFSMIFSLIFGAGAIFILTWNATVIGAAIGNFIRVNLAAYTASLGLLSEGNYLHIVSLGLLKYSIHGIPEITAYFYGGLAGGILSVALMRKHFKSDKFHRVLADFSELLLIAIGFLIAGAFLEVYVTPVLF